MGSIDPTGPLGSAPSFAPFIAQASQRGSVADTTLDAAVNRLRHRLGDRLTSLDVGLGWEGANGQPLHS